MDANRLIKWVVVIALAVVAWKYAIPWAKQQMNGHASSSASDNSCVAAAQRASEAWGSGLHRFANPPYDLGAWSTFHDDVEGKITAAESQCRSSAQSCEAARTAMSELRNLTRDLDTAIRNGSPPPDDAVQRQEAIDTKIEGAADLARSGK
ncbi:MAG TPA: hypothetical protein VNN08_13765 [Thermoanaerobaculia bacterium]|nr:hypothetical protein [Thermoanaerobaculia bacterium]